MQESANFDQHCSSLTEQLLPGATPSEPQLGAGFGSCICPPHALTTTTTDMRLATRMATALSNPRTSDTGLLACQGVPFSRRTRLARHPTQFTHEGVTFAL